MSGDLAAAAQVSLAPEGSPLVREEDITIPLSPPPAAPPAIVVETDTGSVPAPPPPTLTPGVLPAEVGAPTLLIMNTGVCHVTHNEADLASAADHTDTTMAADKEDGSAAMDTSVEFNTTPGPLIGLGSGAVLDT